MNKKKIDIDDVLKPNEDPPGIGMYFKNNVSKQDTII